MRNTACFVIVLLHLAGLVDGAIVYRDDFYTCENAACVGDCKVLNECRGKNWLSIPACRHCEEGYFGANCKAFSPRCRVSIEKNNTGHCMLVCDEQSLLEIFLHTGRNCRYHCVSERICIDKYQQPICEAPCEQCYNDVVGKRVACQEGMCVVQWKNPPRVCAFGYGIARMERIEALKSDYYKCAKCSDSNCGSGVMCDHRNFMECSCNPSDYQNNVAPSSCRRCPVDKWGKKCENTCFCSDDAVCDLDTGVCQCEFGENSCTKCANGRTGERCEHGCKVHCMPSTLVRCHDEFCYGLRNDERVCPFGYGAYNIKLINIEGERFRGFNCTRCFSEREEEFTCGVSDATPMCDDTNYLMCSCKAADYKSGEVPAGCRACNDPKKWGPDCEFDCQCDDSAICDYRTGHCTCPKDEKGVKIKCRRCKFLRSGDKCDEKCTGKCNDDQLVECKADRCIALVPHIRPCAFGYGASGPFIAKTGAHCTRCFGMEELSAFTTTAKPITGDEDDDDDYDVDEDEEEEEEDEDSERSKKAKETLFCGSEDVTCSSKNFSKCSCEPFDYATGMVPSDCRRCPRGKFGESCESNCLCIEAALCNDRDGTCYCNGNRECELQPCIKGFFPRSKDVTKDDFQKTFHKCWPIDPSRIHFSVSIKAIFKDSRKMYLPAIYAVPCIALTLALFGCCVEVVLDRDRIRNVYWQQMEDMSGENIMQ